MSIKKTHEEFMKQVELNNEWYRNGYFTIEGIYLSAKKGILVKTPYGYCKCSVETLVTGIKPHIRSALNKDEYFHNMLLEKNTHYRKDKFKIISKYESVNKKIQIENNYGICEVYGVNLLKGHEPNIVSAVCPTTYWLNMVYEKRGKHYDYSNTVYKGDHVKVIIRCTKHDIYFKQSPTSHYFQNAGCPVCGKESSNSIVDSSNSKGYFYVLKCYSEKEEFLKLGHTIKSVKARYNHKKAMPYKYIVETCIEGSLANVLGIEEDLKRDLIQKRYKPNKSFNGSKTETFCIEALQEIEYKINEVFYQHHWADYIRQEEEYYLKEFNY